MEQVMGELNILIKDDRMLVRISELAREHNRSPDLEALELISAALDAAKPFDRLADAQRISAMTPKGVKQTDSVLLIRQDRDR
jgi:hypothetical protein